MSRKRLLVLTVVLGCALAAPDRGRGNDGDGKPRDLAAILHEGYLAYPVPLERAAAGWLIPTESWVEVFCVRTTTGPEKFSKILMRNVRVIAVDLSAGVAGKYGTVTLEVSREEAKVLNQTGAAQNLTLAIIGRRELERVPEEDRYLPQNRKGEPFGAPVRKITIDDLVRTGFLTFTIAPNPESAGIILPENRVQIFGARKVPGAEAVKAFLVMKNIRVLAVDDITGLDRRDGRATQGIKLTLEVTEAEIKSLIEAGSETAACGRSLDVAVIPNREIRQKTEAELDAPGSRAGDPGRTDPMPK